MTNLSAQSPKDGNPSGEARSAEVVEPHCRICQDHRLRRRANTLLDWRGIPIMMGDRTRKITYRTILSWLNQGRPREDPISYDSLWIHAKRHYSLAGIIAYWSARMDKEWRAALEALRSTGHEGDD